MTDNRTNEMRSLLKERGVGYKPTRFSRLQTTFTANGIEWIVTENESTGELFVEPRHGLTPEQAIAATLGNPTCEYVIEDNMNESEGMGDVWFRCTNCNTCYDYYADDWLLKMPHCPKCGATVKGVR